MRPILASLAAVLGLLLPGAEAAGAERASAIVGTVRDAETGEPLAGAVVSLPDLDRAVLTGEDGRYALERVPAGPQHVAVRRAGYAIQTFHALVPRAGAVEIHVSLRPEPIPLRTVEVRGGVPLRGLDRGDTTAYPDRGLSMAAVRNHPLLSEPDPLQALGGGEVVLRPEAPSGLHVHGGASDQLAYVLDDVPVFSPYHAAGAFSSWNPDALAHVALITSPTPAYPDALSGAVAGRTRVASDRHRSLGSVSTTQARASLDGPIGRGGAGYLMSLRSSFPGLLVHKSEPSHVTGESADGIAKLEAPLGGGRLRILGYGNRSELDAAARAGEPDTMAAPPDRNEYEWSGTSVGAAWTSRLGTDAFRGMRLQLRGWSARSDANVLWQATDSTSERLDSERRDQGLAAVLERSTPRGTSRVGARAIWSHTAYRVVSDSGGSPVERGGRTPITALFVQHDARPASSLEAGASLLGAWAVSDLHIAPGASVRWKPGGGTLSLSAAYTRRHQFAQSLRNPESVVATIFPVDLWVGAGIPGVPVGRSDLGVMSIEHHPAAGVRVAAQGYARRFRGLALVAPDAGGPYADGAFETGSGRARGVAVEAGMNAARYGVLVSYGLQRVRFEYGDTAYVPDHGATHSIDAGAILFPSATTDVRLGVSAAWGRRGTAFVGPLEWEACNLLDAGCEFAGSPEQRAGPVGGVKLPAYLRVDLGVRKHWHVKIAGRDGLLAVFGTATNLLGRKNVLAVSVDPVTGAESRIEMRPRSPLVVGMDWRF